LEELIDKILGKIQLSSEAEEYLYSIAKKKTFPKGATLIREGQMVDKIYFFVTG